LTDALDRIAFTPIDAAVLDINLEGETVFIAPLRS
jgi:hypothetical protein